MIDFKKLLTAEYLFQINRVALQRSDWVFLIIGVVLVAFAIGFMIWAKFSQVPVTKKLLNRYAKLSWVIGLLEVVWFGARFEYVSFLGSHFMALLIGLIGLIWLGFIVKNNLTTYRSAKKDWEKEQLKLKYLA